MSVEINKLFMVELKDCPFEIMQREWEVNKLIDEAWAHNAEGEPTDLIENILEIGSMYGGSLWCWKEGFSTLEKMVSIDNLIPESDGRYQSVLEAREKWSEVFKEVKEFIPIIADSQAQETIERVKEEFPNGIDFLFIDGDHSYQACLNDYFNYLPLMRKNGIIAIHDIERECKDAWQEIKKGSKCAEFTLDNNGGMGIGVVYI